VKFEIETDTMNGQGNSTAFIMKKLATAGENKRVLKGVTFNFVKIENHGLKI
jgi:hypothetical protein